MRLTRSRLLGGAAAGALVAVGGYELVDRLAGSPQRTPVTSFPPEQHLLDGIAVVVDNDVEVLVPPLHHQVVTARVAVDPTPRALREARAELAQTLRSLEGRYAPSPDGLGITVAWALPYFERFVPAQAARHIPLDRRATAARGRDIRVLEQAERFPSDAADTLLEENDVAVLLRSDSVEAIADGAAALFDENAGLFTVTSVRKGFAGGGFDGGTSLPKKMAMAAGIPGAELIPDTSELFLGFTSTQKHGLGPARIANLETLGYADLTRSGYFAQGTHMHLSHLYEDLEAWYLNFDHRERVDTTFKPGLDVAPETLTVPQPPEGTATAEQVASDYDAHRRIGHSSAIQPASRLTADATGPDGMVYPAGTAIPHRADFNTLDNPFFWSVDPERDRITEGGAAGVHFVVFNPTGDDFRRNRLAMDGVMPDGTTLPFEPGSRGQGFNAVLQTTHRQNFLVPPRRHRSFPLVELRG
jgi:hypothetical protein